LTVGPSIGLAEVKLADLHPVQFAPGLGVQAGLDFAHVWNVTGALLGSLTSLEQSAVGNLSLALLVCREDWGVCAGPMADLVTSDGRGAFGRWRWGSNFGLGVSLRGDALQKLLLEAPH
jgi:hypothetical protein